MKFIDYKDLNLEEFTIKNKVGTTSTEKAVYALESSTRTIYGAFNETRLITLTDEKLSVLSSDNFVWFCDTNFFKERKPNVFNISGVRDKIQVYSKVNKELQDIFYQCSNNLSVKSTDFGPDLYAESFKEFFYDYLELRGYAKKDWLVAVKVSKQLFNKETVTDRGLEFLKDITAVYKEFYTFIVYPIFKQTSVSFRTHQFEIQSDVMVREDDLIPSLTNSVLNAIVSYKSKDLLKYAKVHVNYREDYQRLAKLLGETISNDKLNQLIKECRVKLFFDSLKNLYVDYYYYLCD